MTMLQTISIPEAELRERFAADEEYEFAEYENQEWGDDFDYLLSQVNRVVNDWLREHPVNAHLAGTRTLPNNLHVVQPYESIDLTFVGDLDGTIAGYEFSYDIWGARRLSLASGFSEFRHIRPDAAGIDGAVETAYTVIAHVNQTIRDTNEFVAAL